MVNAHKCKFCGKDYATYHYGNDDFCNVSHRRKHQKKMKETKDNKGEIKTN